MREKDLNMKTRRAFMTYGLGLLSVPAFAHHSTSMYDMDNPVTITGTVKRFEWTNPHAFIFVTVMDKDGKEVEWEVELMSLNHLKSYGWMHTTVKPGDVITCTGGAARSGQTAMIASLIKLPDGRTIKS
jgi:hypothetical protein